MKNAPHDNREADVFWSNVNLKATLSVFLLARFIIHSPGQFVYIYIYIHISMHAAIQTHAHILKWPHYICLAHLQYYSMHHMGVVCPFLGMKKLNKKKTKQLNANTVHGSVSGSHRVHWISECSSGYVVFFTKRFMVLTAMLRCEEGCSEVRRLITCESPLSTVSSKLSHIMTPESRVAHERG